MLRRFFLILLIILSPALLQAGIVYDTMDVRFALLQPIGAVASTLQFPTLYVGSRGLYDTSMRTEVVLHGVDGQDSVVVVTGEPEANYTVSFSRENIPLTGPMEGLVVSYVIRDGLTNRTLSRDGVDYFGIRGTLDLRETPAILAGKYEGQIYIFVEYTR